MRDVSLRLGNKVSVLADLDGLAGCSKLREHRAASYSSCLIVRRLSLVDNPVTRHASYRMYVIAKLGTSLKSLDFKRVTEKERVAAKKAFADGNVSPSSHSMTGF